ncbi:MAG TPA: iron ABC transporter permease [Elusimicrobia bacterium]|jgi:iron complex transport system permease protein|nr:iron ABC transporter permease [Elusimicrobiota bacterium]
MKRNVTVFIFLILFLFLTFFFSLIFGGRKILPQEIFQLLMNKQADEILSTIVWKIRLPRIILSLVIGAGLASCGCVFQGILRNPLAEPYTLGISGGAALGAVVGNFLSNLFVGYYSLPICSFFGALASIFLVYFVASRKKFSVTGLILGGVILSFLFSSFVLFLFALFRADKFHNVILWLMGDLSSAETETIKVVTFAVILGFALLFVFSRELNILTLGEEKATSLGIPTETVKKLLFLVTSLIIGTCVSAAGLVGFVGLIIPHFFRWLSGSDQRILLPASFLGGAIFLGLADTLARTIIYPIELPVGVITGIIGGLFFLIFFVRSRQWQIYWK